MVIASLNSENISVFSIFENREYFSAQLKRPLFRNKRKMTRKKIATCDFFLCQLNILHFMQKQVFLFFPGHCGGAMMLTYSNKGDRHYYYYHICSKDTKLAVSECPVTVICGYPFH